MARKTSAAESDIPPGPFAIRFDELVGHARQRAVLSRALARGALAQSLILTGPSGVGKATFARMAAAALQCVSPSPGACGECLPCRKMRKGIHPDLRVLSFVLNDQGKMSKEIKVPQIRQDVVEVLSLPPYEGKRLVFLIDPADAMNEEAQNALLKSIEEPPSYVQFLLVTASPAKLLPTVRSRCQALAFGPLERPEMETWLSSRTSIPRDRWEQALAFAGGRPGRLASFRQDSFLARRTVLLDLLENGLAPGAAQRLIPAIEKLAKDDAAELLEEVSGLVAEAARCLLGLSPRTHLDAAPDLARIGAARGQDGLIAMADRLAEAPAHREHNVNARLMWERIFLVP